MNSQTAATRKAALYLRVSTDGQTVENQRLALASIAEKAGWEIVEVYQDEGISGAKGRDQRPAFDALCKDAARRRFDLIAAWSVDRLGRSLQHLVTFLDELHQTGIDLYLHQQGIDTTTPSGKAMFQMLGVFSEFERAMIRERVNTGLARAKAQGKALGRPKTPPETEQAILAALAQGKGIIATAKAFNVGTSVVQRLSATLKAQPDEPAA